MMNTFPGAGQPLTSYHANAPLSASFSAGSLLPAQTSYPTTSGSGTTRWSVAASYGNTHGSWGAQSEMDRMVQGLRQELQYKTQVLSQIKARTPAQQFGTQTPQQFVQPSASTETLQAELAEMRSQLRTLRAQTASQPDTAKLIATAIEEQAEMRRTLRELMCETVPKLMQTNGPRETDVDQSIQLLAQEVAELKGQLQPESCFEDRMQSQVAQALHDAGMHQEAQGVEDNTVIVEHRGMSELGAAPGRRKSPSRRDPMVVVESRGMSELGAAPAQVGAEAVGLNPKMLPSSQQEDPATKEPTARPGCVMIEVHECKGEQLAREHHHSCVLELFNEDDSRIELHQQCPMWLSQPNPSGNSVLWEAARVDIPVSQALLHGFVRLSVRDLSTQAVLGTAEFAMCELIRLLKSQKGLSRGWYDMYDEEGEDITGKLKVSLHIAEV